MFRKRTYIPVVFLVVMVLFILTACSTATEPPPPPPAETEEVEPTEAPPTEPPPTEPAPPTEIQITGSASKGGLLYDKWWKTLGLDEPAVDQPLWATQSTNTRSGADTWRCKECHGWDYKGADGAYGSGSHFTGFVGVFEASSSKSQVEILADLDGTAIPDHDFSVVGEEALGDLVIFLSEGLEDVAPYIDAESKAAVGGDGTHGEELFNGICIACHGADGQTLNFGSDEEPEYVGTIAVDNPWEFIHKVRAGQPGSQPPMPSGIDSGWSLQDVVDVLTYAQTLPAEAEMTTDAAVVTLGGRLYDKWWKELGLDEPGEDNPVWARQETNTRSGGDTWRCKECHGWDYKGAEGAYGSGSHFTGFPGIFAAQGKSEDEILAQLTGAVDVDHDYSTMGEDALSNLVNFIKEGLVDVSPLIDPETKAAVGGDLTHGGELYSATCVVCHGEDGRTLNFGDDDDPEYVATIALDNPWEFFHKVRVGQPGSVPPMPASIDAGWSLDDLLDLLAYVQTLPIEAP
jgi:thiosulfate dehydrogenase